MSSRKAKKHVERIEKIYALLREYITLCEKFDKARRTRNNEIMRLIATNLCDEMFDDASNHDKANIRGDFGITLLDIQNAREFKKPEKIAEI